MVKVHLNFPHDVRRRVVRSECLTTGLSEDVYV